MKKDDLGKHPYDPDELERAIRGDDDLLKDDRKYFWAFGAVALTLIIMYLVGTYL